MILNENIILENQVKELLGQTDENLTEKNRIIEEKSIVSQKNCLLENKREKNMI